MAPLKLNSLYGQELSTIKPSTVKFITVKPLYLDLIKMQFIYVQ